MNSFFIFLSERKKEKKKFFQISEFMSSEV